MNLTELIDVYSWKFGHDLPRYTKRVDIIDAIENDEPINDIGLDTDRERVLAIMWAYLDVITPQMTCDMFCVNCPQGQVAYCYRQFADNYPVETQQALEKFGLSTS